MISDERHTKQGYIAAGGQRSGSQGGGARALPGAGSHARGIHARRWNLLRPVSVRQEADGRGR